MINIRQMAPSDDVAFELASMNSSFHPGEWTTDNFRLGQGDCVVAEDEKGPILFVKYSKSLRISIVWNDEKDTSRNGKALIIGLKATIERARANGYSELVFTTNVPALANYCTKVLGYRKSGDEYILPLEGNSNG